MSRLFSPPSLLSYAVLLALGFIAAFAWLQFALQPVDPQADTQRFIVRKGQSSESIAQTLQEAQLIKSPLAFKYVVARHGLSHDLQAGSFDLSPAMSTQDIAFALTQGTDDLWITFLEGWRREQYAAELEKVYRDHGQDFSGEDFIALTQGKEGYLYPDTYLFPSTAGPEFIASYLENTFTQKVLEPYSADIQASPFNLNQIITLASLVEREANADPDRAIVAGILIKRLQNDWPLQVDATLQYALGLDPQTHEWTPPTAIDKSIQSPYNTYQNPGLPPAPICSPSLASVQAVLNPTATQYWYYLTDNQGQMHYAATLDEHNQNVNRYLR